MESQVPAVVAVVVTTGTAPWLEETLASLAGQHYGELSVLVLVTGERDLERVYVGGELKVDHGRMLGQDMLKVQSETDRRSAATVM